VSVNGGEGNALSITVYDEVYCASSGKGAIHVTALIRKQDWYGPVPLNWELRPLKNSSKTVDDGSYRHEVPKRDIELLSRGSESTMTSHPGRCQMLAYTSIHITRLQR